MLFCHSKQFRMGGNELNMPWAGIKIGISTGVA